MKAALDGFFTNSGVMLIRVYLGNYVRCSKKCGQ